MRYKVSLVLTGRVVFQSGLLTQCREFILNNPQRLAPSAFEVRDSIDNQVLYTDQDWFTE